MFAVDFGTQSEDGRGETNDSNVVFSVGGGGKKREEEARRDCETPPRESWFPEDERERLRLQRTPRERKTKIGKKRDRSVDDVRFTRRGVSSHERRRRGRGVERVSRERREALERGGVDVPQSVDEKAVLREDAAENARAVLDVVECRKKLVLIIARERF